MKLLISRRLPESVMADAEARFDVTCRSVTTPMDHDECVAALAEYDMVLPTLGDAFRADAFALCPSRAASSWRISAWGTIISTWRLRQRLRVWR
jgi:hypothetical protein